MRGRLGRGQGGHPGGTPLPPAPPLPDPGIGPGPPWARGTGNSLLPALIAIRWPEWKITVLAWAEPGAGGCGCLVCALFAGRMSQPLLPPTSTTGSWSPEPEPGGCRRPSGGMRTEDRGGEEWLPSEPLGKAPPALVQLSHGQGARGNSNQCFPRGASGAPIVCGCLCGRLEGSLEIELPLHLPGAVGLCPGGSGCPCPSAILPGRREGQCSLRGAQLAWGGAEGGSRMRKLRPRLG